MLITILTFITVAFCSEHFETTDIVEVEQKINQEIKKVGRKKVLVVFDIDNTLMRMPQNLGSDQWFNWQYENCIATQSTAPFCVANKMENLLDIQGQLFSLSRMLPTQRQTTSVVNNIQAKEVKMILLTSRVPEFRDATMRALRYNNFNFAQSAIGPKEGYPGSYFATKNSLRKVSYINGVYMTAGLDKGLMLKALLKKTRKRFKSIIFVDDHKRHTTNMQQAFKDNKRVNMLTFRYGAMDQEVSKFKAADKSQVIGAWNELVDVTRRVFK